MHCSSLKQNFLAKLDEIQPKIFDTEVTMKAQNKKAACEPAVVPTKRRRLSPSRGTEASHVPSYHFTQNELAFSLYGRTVVQPIDTERIRQRRKNLGRDWFSKPVPPLDQSEKIDIEPSKAVMSFIPQVQLCMSSLPGCGFGVCARERIAKGTVIGPYNGKRVKSGDMKLESHAFTSFYWEIYNNDELDHYIDGSDENASCWMRFIRSARNTAEQNLCAIQYNENIYYRAMKDISVEAELLVWYQEMSDEYFGIPFMPSPHHHKDTRETKLCAGFTRRHGAGHQTSPPAMQQAIKKTRVWVDMLLGSSSNTAITEKPLSEHENEDTLRSESPDVNRTQCDSAEQMEGANSWRCNQCTQIFHQRALLQLHVCSSRSHKPYDCGHCKLSFPNPDKLRAHVTSAHENKRPFKCGYCGRRFAGATTLTNHIRTHTGTKPFTCETCGKSFAQASQLSRHQRILGDCC